MKQHLHKLLPLDLLCHCVHCTALYVVEKGQGAAYDALIPSKNTAHLE